MAPTASLPKTRCIGRFDVSPIGLGCMNLSHLYGTPPSAEAAERLLLRALELGVTLFDTAAMYGFGANEELVGRVLSPHRAKFTLASKCGLHGVDGKRVIDGRPATLRKTCDEALKRLRTEVIDLYYLHRLDRNVPVEDSVGALADLVRQGKVREIGLSEVSTATLRRAHAVHPIAALQNEYSLWTRNAELGTLQACRELGVAFVAFSPVARKFLTGTLRDPSGLEPADIRRQMPRFEASNYAKNLELLEPYAAIAREAHCTMAQLALAWLLHRGDHVVPIPGTTSLAHLEENLGAADVRLSAQQIARLDELINQRTVAGARYSAAAQADIDTEDFA
jgi:aryl-alcohol dehydrogenase-like predicted oxidoreductase